MGTARRRMFPEILPLLKSLEFCIVAIIPYRFILLSSIDFLEIVFNVPSYNERNRTWQKVKEWMYL